MKRYSPIIALSDKECVQLQELIISGGDHGQILNDYLLKTRSIPLTEVSFIRYNQRFMLLGKVFNSEFNLNHGSAIQFVRYPGEGIDSSYPTLVWGNVWVGSEDEVNDWFQQENLKVPAKVWIDLREDMPWNVSISAPAHMTIQAFPFADGDSCAAPVMENAIAQIKTLLASGIPTVVSCHKGQSRSVACVVGAVSNNIVELNTAYSQVKIMRPQANIHSALWRNLMEIYQ
ncbi:protein-tyrosine phosphatase family protein [Paenibacillus sp. Leaf72]|uniref:protein-tyrosine phosphatase family protein n=1 Tax=Paenibacillus sp. Leaf72 TaxID=1736234 RepID=UPI0006F9588E|nr:dual specificity protein phosphatase family protein [Paenibacillus sp. Leaf72]KQN96939.1 hypothetical protein ASF12_22995 [Paenibacillus sp. Leaf72]